MSLSAGKKIARLPPLYTNVAMMESLFVTKLVLKQVHCDAKGHLAWARGP